MILDQILANRRREVAVARRSIPQADLEAAAHRQARGQTPATTGAPPGARRPGLSRALSAPGASLIAEAKRMSPSKGMLRDDYRPGELALDYGRNGAAAVSVPGTVA